MARVAALAPDLLFGSRLQGMLEAAGHEVQLVTAGVGDWRPDDTVEVVLVDLVSAGPDGIAAMRALRDPGPRTLATYSHVDAGARAQALEAGFDAVVPRSRMMRDGPDLVAGLVRP